MLLFLNHHSLFGVEAHILSRNTKGNDFFFFLTIVYLKKKKGVENGQTQQFFKQ